MKRRRLIIGLLAVSLAQASAALPAMAATFVEQIVTQLKAQGFKEIEFETTWLGRTRIQAKRADFTREIVLNPNTGEILRDLWLSKSGAAPKKITIGDDNGGQDGSDNSGGGNKGEGGGDDDGPDEDEPEDEPEHD